ncbi:MAG: FixH family protein [Flavobacteriales bacterium]|nr:FixH family protein [Flavobacteriales bacterium]
MNWGKGITLALIAFAGMMAYFLIRASGNPSPLVTDKYYEQELKYQQRINNTNRADALSADGDADHCKWHSSGIPKRN